jgi:hypothetical protein
MVQGIRFERIATDVRGAGGLVGGLINMVTI